jgi:phosphopantothenoylcysteine decarboxylase/phosphopantothenate--cysteine ligase
MTAAVADWRPRHTAGAKLKKAAMNPVIELEPNPDILATLAQAKAGRTFVGFAAETGDPLPEARRKLIAKGLDLIVANDVSRSDSGFAVDTNRVTLIGADGTFAPLPLLTKHEVACEIVKWCETRRGTQT